MQYVFSNFELDPGRFELRDKGQVVPLEPQVFLLLKLLIENPDRMISRSEIIDKIWNGRSMSNSAIDSRIKSARSAVGDNGTSQHTIRTVHGQGFRFVATATTQSETCKIPAQLSPKAKPLEPRKIPAKPSIVVLPFQYLGTPGPNSTFAEAISHDLIQALSQLRWMFVIARGSAFRFRAPDTDVQKISRALGVRYVLAGSFKTENHSLMITVELSDCRNSEVIWGEYFTSTLKAIHEIRTEIIARVVSALEIYIPFNEARNADLGVSENLDAWSNYHLGLQQMYRFSLEGNAKATAFFERAVTQDHRLARAHAGLSFTSFQDAFMKYNDSPETSVISARRFAERSIELDPLDPFSNLTLGRSYWLEGDLDSSIDWLDRAITLSPNYAHGHYSHAFTDMLSCRPDIARTNVETAFTLSPLDPFVYGMLGTRALSHVIDGDYETASNWAEKAARAPGSHFLIAMIAVIANSLNQNQLKAQYWANNVQSRRSDACQAHFFESFPFSSSEVRNRISGALKTYGL